MSYVVRAQYGNQAGPPTMAGAPQFQLLAHERQLTLDGRAEPLLSVPEHAQELGPEVSVSAAQASLFGWPQPELPLHSMVDGKIPADCLRGWRAKSDAHALNPSEVRSVPECCGRQSCECSRDGNDAERARDLWNGTKRKDGDSKRIGLRHVAAAADLGVLVVTLPPSLRPPKGEAKASIKAWEREVVAALVGFLRKRTGIADGEFYLRANIHPCGEDATVWHPHLNFMVPAWAWVPSAGKAKHYKPFLDLGELREAMREAMVRAFGEAARAESVNCFWKYEQAELGKRHQASYVPRTFPEWSHLKLRPAAYGLAHPKKRPELLEALASLKAEPLPVWAFTKLREGLEPAPITGRGATAEAALKDCQQQLEAHRAACPACRPVYPDYRRTMTVGSPAPPGSDPPGPDPDAARRWSRFPSLQS